MIPISKKARRMIEEDHWFKKCCHIERVDHYCKGRIVQEHCYGRQNNFQDIFVPVCESCNISPDKKTRAWSKLKALEKYEEFLRNKPKFNYDLEKQFCLSFL